MGKEQSRYTSEGLPIVNKEVVPDDFGRDIEELPKVYEKYILSRDLNYWNFIKNLSESFSSGNSALMDRCLFNLSTGYILLDTQGRINEGENRWEGLPRVSSELFAEFYINAICASKRVIDERNKNSINGLENKMIDENPEMMRGYLNWVRLCDGCYGTQAAIRNLVASLFSYNILVEQAIKDKKEKLTLLN